MSGADGCYRSTIITAKAEVNTQEWIALLKGAETFMQLATGLNAAEDNFFNLGGFRVIEFKLMRPLLEVNELESTSRVINFLTEDFFLINKLFLF